MAYASLSKIFIGSIPSCTTEEQVKAEVNCHGKVTEVFYSADSSGKNRGWALINYETREGATRAINNMNNKPIFTGGDRVVEVRFANSRGGSTAGTTKTGVVGAGGGGTAGVGGASININKPESAWQQYFTSEGIPYYCNLVTLQSQWEVPLEVEVARRQQMGSATGTPSGLGGGDASSSQKQGKFGPLGCNLFLFHLPSEWTENDLIKHFQHFGTIVSARIQKDKEDKNKGFGFLSFDNKQSAASAICGMNGFCVGRKYLKVQLKKGEEQHNPLVMAQNAGVPMQVGGMGGSYMGVPAHNSAAVRYTPY